MRCLFLHKIAVAVANTHIYLKIATIPKLIAIKRWYLHISQICALQTQISSFKKDYFEEREVLE